MKKSERTIRYLDLNISAYPEPKLAREFDLAEILLFASRLLRQEKLQRQPRQGAMQHVRLRDIKFTKSKRYAVLLFTLADRDTVDASYERIATGDTRSFKKVDDEGMRFSAHLLIRLASSKSHANQVTHLALLEETRGLSPSTINAALRSAIRKAGTRQYKERDGEVKVCHPLAILEGHFSSALLDELKSGSLDGFTLIRNEEKASSRIDESALVSPRDYQLRLDVVASEWRKKIADIWDHVRARARSGKYETIRVRYTNRDGRSKTHDVKAEAVDALQSLTVRSSKLTLAKPMHYDQKTVNFDFAKQMINLARKG